MVGFFCRAGFRGALVGREGVVPKAIEVRTQRFDTGRIQLVEATVPMRPIDYQMRVLQDPQMLRDRRPADRKTARELADRLRSLEQALEDCSPGRIAQGVQLLSMSVSYH